jgi:hypothetical protein
MDGVMGSALDTQERRDIPPSIPKGMTTWPLGLRIWVAIPHPFPSLPFPSILAHNRPGNCHDHSTATPNDSLCSQGQAGSDRRSSILGIDICTLSN